MADEVKKMQDLEMAKGVDAAQEELAKEGKTYPDNFTRVIDEFDDDVRSSYSDIKDKFHEVGEKIANSDFGEDVKHGYDTLKDKIEGFFKDFDKDHVDKAVDDVKDHIEQAKQTVDDSEAGKAVKSTLDDIKGHFDTIKTSVSSTPNTSNIAEHDKASK